MAITNREMEWARTLVETAQALVSRRAALGKILFGNEAKGDGLLVGAEPSELYATAQRIMDVTVPANVSMSDAIGYIVATNGGVEERKGALTDREKTLLQAIMTAYRSIVDREHEIVDAICTMIEEEDVRIGGGCIDGVSLRAYEASIEREIPRHIADSVLDTAHRLAADGDIGAAVAVVDVALRDYATLQAAARLVEA